MAIQNFFPIGIESNHVHLASGAQKRQQVAARPGAGTVGGTANDTVVVVSASISQSDGSFDSATGVTSLFSPSLRLQIVAGVTFGPAAQRFTWLTQPRALELVEMV